MKSSYESAEHREIHATREALRAHAIDKNNTGRTPQRVIEILASHGCTHPGLLLSDLLTGNLSAGDRRLLRKISASSVPPVTPIKNQKNQNHTPLWEPTVPRVSWDRIARGARPGDSSWSKYHDDTVFANPETEGPAGRSYFSTPTTPEVLPEGHVRIDLSSLSIVAGNNGEIIKLQTWGDMKKLKYVGRLEISPTNAPDKFTIIYSDHRNYIDTELLRVDLEEGIARLMEEARRYYAEEFEEVENPSDTIRIDIDDLRECTGSGPGVVTIPREIFNHIVKLNGLGRIVITKEDIGGFSIEYYSNGNKDSFSGQTIEEIIPEIVFMMRGIYPDRFES